MLRFQTNAKTKTAKGGGVWRTTDDGKRIFIGGGKVRAGGPNGKVVGTSKKKPKPSGIDKKIASEKKTPKKPATSSELNQHEKDAVTSYTTRDYQHINKALRGQGVRTNLKQIDKIDSAISKSKTTADSTVYRAAKIPELEAALAKNGGAGFEFTDKGYVSTSKAKDKADTFRRDGARVYKINVPKGSSALDVGELAGGLKGEQEVLLPRGSTFRVKGTTKSKEKVAYRDLKGKVKYKTQSVEYVELDLVTNRENTMKSQGIVVGNSANGCGAGGGKGKPGFQKGNSCAVGAGKSSSNYKPGEASEKIRQLAKSKGTTVEELAKKNGFVNGGSFLQTVEAVKAAGYESLGEAAKAKKVTVGADLAKAFNIKGVVWTPKPKADTKAPNYDESKLKDALDRAEKLRKLTGNSVIVGNASGTGCGAGGGKGKPGFQGGNTCAVGSGRGGRGGKPAPAMKKPTEGIKVGKKASSTKLTKPEAKLLDSIKPQGIWKGGLQWRSKSEQKAIASLVEKGVLVLKGSGEKAAYHKSDKADSMEKPAAKSQPLFPKLSTGSYTARFGFMDETRGERHFDSNYAIQHKGEGIGKNQFRIRNLVSHNGSFAGQPSQIGSDLKPGTSVSVTVSKWTTKGKSQVGGKSITIKDVKKEDHGDGYVTYLVTHD